eukprot:786915-Rhodomonas_salina.4
MCELAKNGRETAMHTRINNERNGHTPSRAHHRQLSYSLRVPAATLPSLRPPPQPTTTKGLVSTARRPVHFHQYNALMRALSPVYRGYQYNTPSSTVSPQA